MDGIYSITFRGAADWGIGLLHLQHGQITGADAAGVTYDGTYVLKGETLQVHMTTTVPPGVRLVQGTHAMPTAQTISYEASVPLRALSTNEPVLIYLPPGPVNVIFRLLRPLGR